MKNGKAMPFFVYFLFHNPSLPVTSCFFATRPSTSVKTVTNGISARFAPPAGYFESPKGCINFVWVPANFCMNLNTTDELFV